MSEGKPSLSGGGAQLRCDFPAWPEDALRDYGRIPLRLLPGEPVEGDPLNEERTADQERSFVQESVEVAMRRRCALALFCCLLAGAGVSLRRLGYPGVHLGRSDVYARQGLWMAESARWTPVGGFGNTCRTATSSGSSENFADTILGYFSRDDSIRHTGITALGQCTELCEADKACQGVSYSNETHFCDVWRLPVKAGPAARNTICLQHGDPVQAPSSHSKASAEKVASNPQDVGIAPPAGTLGTIVFPVESEKAPDEKKPDSAESKEEDSTVPEEGPEGFHDPFTTIKPSDWFDPVDGGIGRSCVSIVTPKKGDDKDNDGMLGNETGPPGSHAPTILLPWEVEEIQDCKFACIHASACTGIEYSHKAKRCKVFTQEIDSTNGVPGFECYRFRPQTSASSDCPEGWPKPQEHFCSKAGDNCLETGCCQDPSHHCFSKDGFWASCKAFCEPGQIDVVGDLFQTPWSCERIGCASYPGRFVPPKKWWSPPLSATEHNGAHIPDVYVAGQGPHNVYVIGDWGGTRENENVAPANQVHKRVTGAFVGGVDDIAQMRVRDAMRDRASRFPPAYFLNVGDNFYWAGVEHQCLVGFITDIGTDQFEEIYEKVYTGQGLDGKQWLGVLGNHDYGGFRFEQGWDKTIGYTWKSPHGRWMTPALYYSTKVWYMDFAIDYIFMDTNVWDAMDPADPSSHNICSQHHNPEGASCGPVGPTSVWDCPYWFKGVWERQKGWLDEIVPKMTADWRIVVTHFPPYWGSEDWIPLAKRHELDLVITGHRHSQHVHVKDDPFEQIWPDDPAQLGNSFLDPTAYIVSGGGGGVTSEQQPDGTGEDDEYGFMHLTMHKDFIKIEALSHGGQSRRVATVKHEYTHKGSNAVREKERSLLYQWAGSARRDADTGKKGAEASAAPGTILFPVDPRHGTRHQSE